jgi:hypothetical protein
MGNLYPDNSVSGLLSRDAGTGECLLAEADIALFRDMSFAVIQYSELIISNVLISKLMISSSLT